MKAISTFFGFAALFLSGCWTLSETEYPTVSVTPANGVRVKLSNFRTGVGRSLMSFKDYLPVEGHETMAGSNSELLEDDQVWEAMPNMSWLLTRTASGRLVARVVTELKSKGYVMDAKSPQYDIEMKFDGPVLPDWDVWHQVWFGLCTLFTAENTVVTWSAKLTVSDGATNKSLFTKDYEQTYEITAWGPIPVASTALCDKVSVYGANSWALTALTDRAMADATAFIADRAK